MKRTGKLDYLELPATGTSIEELKSFYATAFGWSFTDYGPSYAAFDEGLEGGFNGADDVVPKPLPVLYSENLEETFAAVSQSGAAITHEIYSFPGGRRFHFTDPAGNELAVWGE